MYERHWGLREKPFQNTPDPRFLYKPPPLLETHGRLLYALQARQGPIVLVGESGYGKTLLLRSLLQELGQQAGDIALLEGPGGGARGFLVETLYQLGTEPLATDAPSASKPQLRRALDRLLYERFASGQDTTVVIDEAHLLEDPRIFAEIRRLLNLQLDDAFLVNFFLAGRPELGNRVRQVDDLQDRIAAWGRIEALDRDHIGPYIDHRLRVAGRQEPVFSPTAVDLLAQYCGGIPRRLNRICDLCLAIGAHQNVTYIDEDLAYRLVLSEENVRI